MSDPQFDSADTREPHGSTFTAENERSLGIALIVVLTLIFTIIVWNPSATVTVVCGAIAVIMAAAHLFFSTRRTRQLVHQHQNDLNQLQDQIDLLSARHGEQRIIHESMSTGMIALDDEQRVLSVNRAAQQLLGVSEKIAKGQLLRDALQEPELNRFVSQALSNSGPLNAEFKLVQQSGATVHAIAEPLRNGEDKPLGLLVLINDVTRLRQLEALRSDFAANVSHELRTPITNIKGYVETLLDVGVNDSDQTARFLGIIHRNTERLAFIIEDLLALARLEQPDAKGTLQRELTSARSIINAVLAHVEDARAKREVTIRVDVPDDLQMTVNPQLIEQAVSNLVSNAIKYSPARTKVEIRARRNKESDVEISVTDQGPGIAREHLPRLFERFYRVDKARSREIGGTGLGLAIVKHIALVHGGKAEVESTLGKGSTFRIVLPGEA